MDLSLVPIVNTLIKLVSRIVLCINMALLVRIVISHVAHVMLKVKKTAIRLIVEMVLLGTTGVECARKTVLMAKIMEDFHVMMAALEVEMDAQALAKLNKVIYV